MEASESSVPSSPAEVATSLLDRGYVLSRNLEHCKQELQSISARLGTNSEKSDDIERAQDLAHEISNLRTAIELHAGIQALREKQSPWRSTRSVAEGAA